MNKSAIFHQSHDQWQAIVSDSEVEIRLTSGKDITNVSIVFGDPHLGEKTPLGWRWKSTIQPMELAYITEHGYIWTTIVTPENKRLKYHFIIYGTDETLQFGEDGFTPIEEEVGLWNNFFLPYLHHGQQFNPPHWVKDTLWYQIFPERFHNGDKSNDPKGTLEWHRGPVTNKETYGGDIAGIIERLPYLADLGISGIYITPVFESVSTHKYDTRNYFAIDPSFGTEEDLIELVKKAHQLNIKVMLDAVFNHSGADFPFWEDVKKHKNLSEYKDWFHIKSYEPLSYETFSFEKKMPKINLSNPKAKQYFIEAGKYWIKKADIDGWRLDVANEVDPSFWYDFRKEIKAVKEDCYILGEVWHDSMQWLRGDRFDAVMNYPLGRSIIDFALGKISTTQFRYRMDRAFSHYPSKVSEVQFNLLDSHDTARLRNILNHDLRRLELAFALLFISFGSICIYYGSEIAMEGEFDPDCRRCMIWDPNKEEKAFFQRFKRLIALRNQYACLRNDSNWRWIETGDLLVIERSNENQSVWMFVNTATHPLPINIEKYVIDPKDAFTGRPHATVVNILPNQYIFITN
jgi:cyclomaltodextrinase / maltogenic alpha-amylase / neopullulanase